MKIKLLRYNAKDNSCDLCGCTPEAIWKFGIVELKHRANHFCDACMNLIDAPSDSVDGVSGTIRQAAILV